MDIINDLVDYLRNLGYTVERDNNFLMILHGSLPLYLRVEFRGNLVYMCINYKDNIREALEDLKDSGEDVEEVVEDAISYLSIASLKIRQWIEDKGFIPVFKLRNGSLKVYEILEDVLEE
ncbi:MAG: hypothetical protein QXE81_05620 [Desulfurococcaceae archaeon]